MELELLEKLCGLHSTPGDEGEVFEALLAQWRAQGLDTRRLGAYAVVAEPGERKKSDTILLVAHADSPGFIVEAVCSPTELSVLTLGGIHPAGGERLRLKCAAGEVLGTLQAPPEEWSRTMALRVVLDAPCTAVAKGDRLCWARAWRVAEGRVTSPFLDNRIGCALVAEWYAHHSALLAECNVVLAATAMEEVNGFGAKVLAREVKADAVIVLDVTYTSEKMAVAMGQGAVVTLSDNSVLLSPALRDRLLAAPVPLQTEVYNYAGTDARAFPEAGWRAPVCPLLLATEGNHSPSERVAVADLEAWPKAIAAVARVLCAQPIM
ncbi:MAG: M20/M25/M40 family metallo-hydrolase [Candidatus Spyradenecus sp.]